jgi:beta-lactamase regulating signal transducer with metallopeptidase domain
MTAWGQLFAGPAVERLGWALVHFLWQGAAVALLLAPVLVLMRRRPANARYVVCCAALLAMAACPLATVLWTAGPAPAKPVRAKSVAPITPPPAAARVETPAPMPVLTPAPAAAAELPPVPAVVAAPLPPPPPQPWWESVRTWTEAHMAWFVAAWAAGVLALSLRLLAGWMAVWRMTRSGRAEGCVTCREAVARLARRMRVSRPVRVLESALAQAPVVAGWLRPVILLPASALSGLTPEQLEAILAHELAHVRRHDYVANLVQTAIETLLFYHPAVHWV